MEVGKEGVSYNKNVGVACGCECVCVKEKMPGSVEGNGIGQCRDNHTQRRQQPQHRAAAIINNV